MTDTELIEAQQKLIERYEEILDSIATMLDNGITDQHGSRYAWEHHAGSCLIPDAIDSDKVHQAAWTAREEANAALCFDREECGVEG